MRTLRGPAEHVMERGFFDCHFHPKRRHCPLWSRLRPEPLNPQLSANRSPDDRLVRFRVGKVCAQVQVLLRSWIELNRDRKVFRRRLEVERCLALLDSQPIDVRRNDEDLGRALVRRVDDESRTSAGGPVFEGRHCSERRSGPCLARPAAANRQEGHEDDRGLTHDLSLRAGITGPVPATALAPTTPAPLPPAPARKYSSASSCRSVPEAPRGPSSATSP